MVQTSESHNADTMYTRIKNYFNIDRQQLALNLVWYWAWVGLKFTKIVEYIFRLVLSLPNGLLVNSQPDIKTTTGQKIELLNALDERGDVILNKLNLFLKLQATRPHTKPTDLISESYQSLSIARC